ncbi:MAG: Gx transporter family protein [Ruminococcus sp.]|nr:Gx transporter family protein [Ruminococcus sp.]
MKTKRLTELSLLTGLALIIFVVELRFPDIIPVPGVKLGLANIITVYAVYKYKAAEAFLLVLARVILGTLFASTFSALIYSLSGAAFCLAGMLLLHRIIPLCWMWLCSIIGAILHNTGQIAAAAVVMKSFAVFAYYPLLIIAGCIAGAFTGVCAQLVIKKTKEKRG